MLSSISRWLEPLMKYSYSFSIYYMDKAVQLKAHENWITWICWSILFHVVYLLFGWKSKKNSCTWGGGEISKGAAQRSGVYERRNWRVEGQVEGFGRSERENVSRNGTNSNWKQESRWALRESNKELENYAKTLEETLGTAAYKGEVIAEVKNKTRMLKCFLSRVEMALWFSESFGLQLDSRNVEEMDTGIGHNLKVSH